MIRSIVVGTDGSETATEALRQVAELAHSVGAKVHVVNAYAPVAGVHVKGTRRFLLGSVPDKISHHAPCAVLIVRTT